MKVTNLMHKASFLIFFSLVITSPAQGAPFINHFDLSTIKDLNRVDNVSDSPDPRVREVQDAFKVIGNSMKEFLNSDNPYDQEAAIILVELSKMRISNITGHYFENNPQAIGTQDFGQKVYDLIENRVETYIINYKKNNDELAFQKLERLIEGNFSDFIEAVFTTNFDIAEYQKSWRPDMDKVKNIVKKAVKHFDIEKSLLPLEN